MPTDARPEPPAAPRKVLPAPWLSSTAAAAELNLSPWTVRRRVHSATHWIEGVHFRWVQKQQKRFLQVHLENVRKLLIEAGW